jgi:hypothetical protein
MSDPSQMSDEDLQKEHARALVTLEGLQERMEEVRLLEAADSDDASDQLYGQAQACSTYLQNLEEEMQRRGMAGG